MSGRRLIVTKQVRTMTVAFLLLCVLNFWTLQVMSHDTLHRHYSTTTTESKDLPTTTTTSSSTHSLNNKKQAPLVNQHALVQVQVSMECFLEQQQQQDLTLLLNNAKKKESFVLSNDIMMLHSSSWFVMISEVPSANKENTETSLHIDQAVDSFEWKQTKSDENDSVSLSTTASLSFLIPLFATTERTLIVSLMEHDYMGNSRIATRRLVNVPPSKLTSTSVGGTTNKRSSAVLTVDLSTRTTCTVPASTTRLENDGSLVGNKTVGMCLVLFLVVLVVYLYPNKQHQAATITGTIQQEEETRTSIQQQQEEVNVRRLKRTIVIDSPSGSSSDSSTCSSTILPGDESDDVQDSSNGKKKSLFIKPPSLVRIPYSFAAEHESLDENEESSLSVESGTVPPQHGGIRAHAFAFPSPVLDVNKDASENEMKDNETDNGAKATIPEEPQGPRNLIRQQDTAVVEHLVLPSQAVVDVTEAPIAQDTTEVDTVMMDTSETAVDSDKTRLSVDQDTSDAMHTVGETEREVRQDAIVQQPPTEPASFAPETATLAVAQSTLRPPTEQQGDDRSDHMSSSSENSTVSQQGSDEGNAAGALADISKVDPVSENVDTSRTTSATQPVSATNPPPFENAQPSEVVDASFGSAVESKVPPPLEMEQTLESQVEHGQDSHHGMNASNKNRDSVQERATEKESSRTTDEPLNVQDRATDKNDVLPTDGNNDDVSAHNDDQQEANQEVESKVIDVEYIPMDESNWLKRLRERPSAITSCSVGQNDAPPAATSDAAQEERKEPEKDELSYTSTLPPDSFGGDDFSVDDAAPTSQDNAVTDATNETLDESAINPNAQDMPLPRRKKRRLPPLKSRQRRDEDSAVEQQHARPDKTHSRKQAESTTTELATALVPLPTATTKASDAPAKPRPKKPLTDTVVPDVVPSVLLQAASKEVTDVTWNFSKAASTARRRKQEKQQRSRRRKRKAGPPSLIILLDDDSPVPPQHHSVVSRGSSSRVPKKKSSQETESKKRRLKK